MFAMYLDVFLTITTIFYLFIFLLLEVFIAAQGFSVIAVQVFLVVAHGLS